MNLDRVGPGANIPDEINVIIEIPSHSDPVKYEVDKDTGAMFVDRFMTTAMFYPCNYGYVPHSVALISGSVIRCRPIGMLNMTDEAGMDAKIIAVPINKLSSEYKEAQGPDDLPESLLKQISHFFEHYKDLESNKWVKVEGWSGADDAKAEIMASVNRYNKSPEKPYF